MEKEWQSLSIENVEKELDTSIKNGLSEDKVEKNRETYGLNEITTKGNKSIFQMLIEQFKDFMIIILLIAAFISGWLGIQNGEGFTDSIIILVIVILNAIIGVAQELKAQKSLDALKNLSAPHCKVIRNGEVHNIESKFLVPGDVVSLDTGDYVPADLRLIEEI